MRDRSSRVFLTGSPTVNIDITKAKANRRLSRTPFSDKHSTSAASHVEALAIPGSSFGKEGLHITIGISRPEDRPPPASPGPGAYNPPSDPLRTSRLRHRFPTAFIYDSSAEPSIDYQDTRSFPASLPRYIGTRLDRPFFDIVQTPAPSYCPPSTLTSRAHRITSRTPIPGGPDSPSPCAYNPKWGLPGAPQWSLMGPRDRTEWLTAARGPAPTDYDPDHARVRACPPVWTIGTKSRLSKKRRTAGRPNPRSVGMGRIVITIDPEFDVEESRKWLDGHPIVRKLVAKVVDVILKQKPEDPIDLMRDWLNCSKEEFLAKILDARDRW